MDKSQASIIVGLDLNFDANSDEILDAVEEAVFKQVTFFVRRPFLPVLATKCIKRLREIDLAAEVLGLPCELAVTDHLNSKIFSDQNDLLSVLSIYHSHESELKSKLVNTTKPSHSISLYNQWILLFESFARYYISNFQKLNIDNGIININEVRISEVSEFNDLYKELKELKYNNLALQEYYRLQKLIIIPE